MVHEDVIGSDSRPPFFEVRDPEGRGLVAPPERRDIALRTYARSLSGMQKEAVVVSSTPGPAWRMVSDEGPSMGGHDRAPFPLAFLSAGLAASYTSELLALSELRDVSLHGARLTLENFYTIEGSAIRGTMVSGALAPQLRVEVDVTSDPGGLLGLCAEAVDASALNGLVCGDGASLFTLTHNGERLDLGASGSALQCGPEPYPPDALEDLPVDGPDEAHSLLRRSKPTDPDDEPAGGPNSGLRAERPKRTLQVRAVSTVRDDAMIVIDVSLAHRSSSVFRFLCDEHPRREAGGRAPDAAALVSAGIAFCFMTQFGRYASIQKKVLESYRIVQDTHLSLGGASGATGQRGLADPVETHVYLQTPEGEDFARSVLKMGEQTCFLHALCQTALKTKLSCQATAQLTQQP